MFSFTRLPEDQPRLNKENNLQGFEVILVLASDRIEPADHCYFIVSLLYERRDLGEFGREIAENFV